MERLWNTGGKNWAYEYKYRRDGKTLCSLFVKGTAIIFGENIKVGYKRFLDSGMTPEQVAEQMNVRIKFNQFLYEIQSIFTHSSMFIDGIE